MMPDRQYGDRNEDHRRAMTDLQTNLNNGNRQYLGSMRRTGTPPNGYFSGFSTLGHQLDMVTQLVIRNSDLCLSHSRLQ